MDILLACILFLLGIALVVKGGDVFVDSASAIARAMAIPPFIIGATIVSFATTMPEMIVSVIAALQGKTEMAVGNAVGSVTANTALILAVAMVSMTILCSRKQYLRQILLLLAAAGVLLLSCLSGVLNPVGGAVLALLFAAFMMQNVLSAKGRTTEQGAAPDAASMKPRLARHILLFVLGAGAIVGGSQLMVTNGSSIALWLGVPERIIAVTLIAVGTSLPELVTTVTAIVKKESGLSIGNIIGANLIDLALILPVCSLLSGRPLPVSPQSVAVDIPVSLMVTLIAMLPLLLRQKASRAQGALLLVIYAVYLICVI